MTIGSLRGTLTIKEESEIILEVTGVGYRIQISPSTFESIGPVGEKTLIYIHHLFIEDNQIIYWFIARAECLFFEALIAAHGVGPSLGLAILSTYDPEELSKIIANEDAEALCLVPGIGKKTAARLIIELQSKLHLAEIATSSVSSPSGTKASSNTKDVREALTGLGYGNEEIYEAMKDLPTEGDVSDLLKLALRELASVSS